MYGYRIEPLGNPLVVIDSLNEVVGRYLGEAKAKQSIAECRSQDAQYRTARDSALSPQQPHRRLAGVPFV
jgi:hypothetical protein